MRLTHVTLPGLPQTTNSYAVTASAASAYLHTTKSITQETSAAGKALTRTFDPNFRLKTETAAPSTTIAATTRYDYDYNGNQKTITDPRGAVLGDAAHTTTIDYDSRNRKIRTTSPPVLNDGVVSNQVTEWKYDEAGNVTSIKRPDTTIETKT